MKVNSGIYARVVVEPTVYYVRSERTGWVVTCAGRGRPLSAHASKGDAVMLATKLARRNATVVIEGEDDGHAWDDREARTG